MENEKRKAIKKNLWRNLYTLINLWCKPWKRKVGSYRCLYWGRKLERQKMIEYYFKIGEIVKVEIMYESWN